MDPFCFNLATRVQQNISIFTWVPGYPGVFTVINETRVKLGTRVPRVRALGVWRMPVGMARHLAALTDSIPERTTWLSLAQPELLLSTKVFVVLLLCIGRPTSVLCTLIHMPCIQVFFKKPCSSCTGYLVTPVGIPNRFPCMA